VTASTRLSLIASLLVISIGPTASAGEPQTQADKIPPTVLALTPAIAPRPALKFPLLPELRDQIPANAALCYQRALLHLRDRKERLPKNAEDWLTAPVGDVDKSTAFSRAEARKLIEAHAVWEGVINASRCMRCDWEPRPDAGVSSSIAIPDLRELDTFLALSARVDIVDGNFDRALRTIQHGFALARNVGQAPEVIGIAQGVSIASHFLSCLEDLAQSPGSPSLYWSLTTLPQPLIPWPNAAQGDRSSLFKDFPELRGLEDKPLPEKEVAVKLVRVMSRLERFAGGAKEPDAEAIELLLTSAIKKFHKPAKERLAACGFTKEQIEALPAVQALALSALLKYREVEDEYYKLTHLPYWEAQPRLKQLDAEVKQYRSSEEAFVPALFVVFHPFYKFCFAAQRVERRIAALRCVEAIRLYAAEHDGRLPQSLTELRKTPTPLDPYTGKGFEYSLHGTTALLYGPPPPGEPPVKDGNVISYRLTIKR
jgi:hypothetical protein